MKEEVKNVWSHKVLSPSKLKESRNHPVYFTELKSSPTTGSSWQVYVRGELDHLGGLGRNNDWQLDIYLNGQQPDFF